MSCFLGIDGGGSNLRTVLTNANLTVLAEFSAGTANPRLIGHDAARQAIHTAIHETCQRAGVRIEQVIATGIGIAGASVEHSRDWLYDTLHPLLTDAHLALSSDYEIALVGALGQRDGLLILAGTGSAAYGHAPDGRSARVGGWGYLLGDEGSGFWIGVQALKYLMRQFEQQGRGFPPESLAAFVLRELKLSSMTDLLHWVYDAPQVPVQAVAALTPLVIDHAGAGDSDAAAIVNSAARALHQMLRDLQSALEVPDLPVAFAGGLLSADNALSRELCRLRDLPQRPVARYTPAVGAALLAQLSWKESHSA